MKLSEIIKALEEGKTVKADNLFFYNTEYYKDDKLHCIGNILNDIACNKTFEIVEPNKVVEVYGRYFKSYMEWSFNEAISLGEDTHKITFEVDKDNNPICETIKMIEL